MLRSILPLFFQINRKRRTPHGQYISEEKILTIDIKAGWKSGTKITFAKEGDEKPGYHAGDIIFVVQVKYHKYFQIFFFKNLFLGKRTHRLDTRWKQFS